MELTCGNCTKFKSEFDLDIYPIDSNIYRGTPVVMINLCVKYHRCRSKFTEVIVRKRYKVLREKGRVKKV